MRIGLLLQGGKDWAGGMEYTRSIALAVGKLPQEERKGVQMEIICGENVPQDVVEDLRPVVARVHNDPGIVLRPKAPEVEAAGEKPQPGIFRKLLGTTSERASRPAEITAPEFDFIYPYGRDPKHCNAQRSAAWMWDFQHKYLPQLFTAEDIAEREKKFAKLAKLATTIVFSSNACLADFRKFYPDSKVRTEVLHFRAIARDAWYEGDPASVVGEYSLPPKFFLVCSQFWQHKNHRAVLAALQLLKNKNITVPVVFTGLFHDHRNPFYCSELLHEIHAAGLGAQIFLLGLTPRRVQLQLMRCAAGLIQPSRFEGWSTVVEEARALGKFMLLSDIAVHREQNPSDAQYFGCDDPEALAALIEQEWKARTPGPDLEAERKARAQNAAEIEHFAHRFLEIASG